jgi:hypothetical protein
LNEEPAPQLLLIVQEQLRPGSDTAYAKIERHAASVCARLSCPNPYLAAESVTSPKEVWWFNAFASVAEKERVERALMDELQKVIRQKETLAHEAVTFLATYRADLSTDCSWRVGGAE